MEEEIQALKNSNTLYDSAKLELEELLQSAEGSRREAEEETARCRAEVGRLRKELAGRSEELREYAGVCVKLEQNCNAAGEENEHLMAELQEGRE
jgi:dsDNA-specific endonuclease/ATPase MutS2